MRSRCRISAFERSGSSHRGISSLLACLAGGALLAIPVGWTGESFEPASIVQQAAPIWPLLALALLLPLWFLRKETVWRLSIAAGAVFAACIALSLPPLRGSPWPKPDAPERALRIVELNAWLDNREPAAAAAWISGQRPDIVILLEGSGRSAMIADALAPLLPYRTSCRTDRRCSTLILSRIAPIERRGLARGDADNRKALSAAFVRFGPPWPRFAVLAVHLSRPLPLGAQRREIAQLADAMAAETRERLIVAGDFNATPWSSAFRRMARLLGVSPLGSEAPSWPAPPAGLPLPPLFPIDHVLLGPGWAAAQSVRGPAVGSDHYPFTITLVPGDAHVAR